MILSKADRYGTLRRSEDDWAAGEPKRDEGKFY
jgi:hypothetical protein